MGRLVPGARSTVTATAFSFERSAAMCRTVRGPEARNVPLGTGGPFRAKRHSSYTCCAGAGGIPTPTR